MLYSVLFCKHIVNGDEYCKKSVISKFVLIRQLQIRCASPFVPGTLCRFTRIAFIIHERHSFHNIDSSALMELHMDMISGTATHVVC